MNNKRLYKALKCISLCLSTRNSFNYSYAGFQLAVFHRELNTFEMVYKITLS